MMWGYNAFSWLWMVPVMVIFWALMIGLIVVVIRAIASPWVDRGEALQALRKRLASGEITPEEFEQSRRLLLS
jgi:putative membrane protein